jgi:hypothetical protein
VTTLLALPALLRSSWSRLAFATLILAAVVSFTTGCGSSGMSKASLTGNTDVTVMVSSTASDQLSEFDLGFQGITLTSQSGKTATLLLLHASGPPVGAEFMHINGTVEPLATASIAQDVYTSATVTLGSGGFTCIALGPVDGQETLSSANFSLLGPASTVTVSLPSPITVTGASMALSLNLLVSQSATFPDCLNVDGFTGFSMTPTFNLTPLSVSASPTNSANGKVAALDGQITALAAAGNGFTLSIPNLTGPRPLSVTSNSNTVYQGISGNSALTVGTFVNMDGAIRSDGSLLATRIAVEDTSAGDVFRGPLMQVAPSVSVVLMHAREQQGKDFPGYVGGFGSLNFGSTVFQTSGQLTNLGSLPFVPSFNASNMVPGQEVYISIPSFSFNVVYPVATTMTLMPQTINGTVRASTPSGNFTDYTVTLAPYDLFPMLANQPSQTTVENNPSQLEVYVDSNTQLLNAQALAASNTLRFYGLVFNDNGTLRMDCAQVNDGVSVSSVSNVSGSSKVVQTQTIRRAVPGGVPQMITTVRGSR